MRKLTKNDTVTIVGRRWFEKVNGNTYHSFYLYVNGELIAYNPFNYGYDTQYLQNALCELGKHFDLKVESVYKHSLHKIKEVTGANFVVSVSDVKRRKDLEGNTSL